MKYLSTLVLGAFIAMGCSKTEDEGATKTTQEKTKEPEKVTIKIACGSVGKEQEECKKGTAEWAKKTGHTVEIVSMPKEASDILPQYQKILSAKSDAIDVFQIDIIWPGILHRHMVDLKQYSKGAESNHFEAIIANNTVEGKLVAMPWFTDAGILYYRKDLLEKHGEAVPSTWEELTATAKKIQDAERAAGNDKMWGFVWQGKAYEGLTCDAVEWIVSYGGGTIIDDQGKVTINNEKAAAALDMAAGWVGTISPEGVLNYGEEEARGVFQTGNAVFMRNWPYAWSLAQADDSPIKDKVGVATVPKGPGPDGRHAAALGGWNLAVSSYSQHPEIAADLVMHLTGAEEQKRRAVEASYNPTIASVYKDQDVLDAVSFFGELYETFVTAVPRPSTVTAGEYNQVSKEFSNAVHAVLRKDMSASDSLTDLADKLAEIGEDGWK
ncbi:ABC transporter substrate-binding protein [Haliangium sp.]|uniref:ABC transporter substrate-binding protein n=1 Tax=Haliangium sp. TaxID=2663208 RepID=UPI003D0EA188